MDIPRPIRPRNSESSPSQRFLGDFSPRNPSPASPSDELSEDDIFSTVDFTDNHHRAPQSPAPRHLDHHHYNHHHQHSRLRNSIFSPPESFGILAALPENEPRSVFNNQASPLPSAASPPATASSSRMIPAIPRRPPQDRFPIASSSSFSARYNQSAPVNVPTLSKTMTARRRREFVEVDEEVEEEDAKDLDGEEMLPPHEIVARRLSRSQSVACSVLEGAGRTLKGRDLRRVRNAVWRQTGFLD